MNVMASTGPRLRDILDSASIEVTANSTDQIGVIKDGYRQGIDVHVTSLPTDTLDQTVAMSRLLRQAGFNPVPHVTARGYESREALDAFLGRVTGEAGVERVLVISGDRPKAMGPFPSSLAVLRTGLIEGHGIRSIAVAGHPEGHPSVSAEVMDMALLEKFAYACDNGLAIDVITQFIFEAEPMAAYIRHLRTLGITARVKAGVTGPANLMTLIRYGMRCGVGNSLRALRQRSSLIGAVAQDATPDELIAEIVQKTAALGELGIGGIHLYVFGGLRKTAEWLKASRSALESR